MDRFLACWFSGFAKSLDKIDTTSRTEILRACGVACANSYTAEIFSDAKRRSQDLESFLANLSAAFSGAAYDMVGDHAIRVRFSDCDCDLVQADFVRFPHLCECSLFNLKESVERALGVPAAVSMAATILRGGTCCEFAVTWPEEPLWRAYP